MCGIFACHHHPSVEAFKPKALQLAKCVRHRGPDWSGNTIRKSTILTHERLSIVGVDTGAQPLVSEDGTIVLAVNGEIYNHRALRRGLKKQPEFKTHSDCEVIMYLYLEHGTDAPNHLDGMFSFTLYDETQDRLIAARDPIGITSFYQGWSSAQPNARYFASELKSLHPVCDKIISFPPGHVYDSLSDSLTRYFQPPWWNPSCVPSNPLDLKLIRANMEAAVRKRLMSEVPYGVLLSGGLDSSLIASIASRETERVALAQRQEVEGTLNGLEDSELATIASWPRLHSFSIGLPGAPDLLAARDVAKFLGTVHHEHTFTLDDGLDALQDVIYHLESFDVTTVRASTPMYLLSRKIKAQGVKMVLSGEGSDEIFGGYLYFSAAPSKEEFHAETVGRVKNLHLADCLRANKSTLAWGVEARVPFLDKHFLESSMSIDPAEKMITKDRMEKWILRKAFDTSGEQTKPYLPHHVLWRQKEQFSDGVGYSWIDALKDAAERAVSDDDMRHPNPAWGDDVPSTKEAWWYRCMFDNVFPPQAASTVMRWVPKEAWGCSADPSGRFVKGHVAAV